MIVFSTYCTVQKETSSSPLPAIKLYHSDRIQRIYQAAFVIGVPCYILSGKYGLIHAEQSIEYYDHQLIHEEVEEHATLVSKQLKEFGISELIFYSNTLKKDPTLQPYLNCVEQACHLAKAELKIIYISLDE